MLRPPGPQLLPDGTATFTVFAGRAERVELCLFTDRERPNEETSRLDLSPIGNGLFSAELEGLTAGIGYGFRAHGPAPCDPSKLLSDPYARAFTGTPHFHLSMVEAGADTADHAPRSALVDTAFDWGDDAQPRIPWEHTVLYEAHVKGMTQLMPEVPEELRGTYAGLANDATIGYLQDLGITAIELLPVHQHLDDGFLLEKDLVNYWGYNTLGFFAPHNAWAAAGIDAPDAGLREFKGMVKALHAAGIEVILDVVYNHTAEGGSGGPTLNLRGLDDGAYYKHDPSHPEAYWDCTGCGNTVNLHHPRALQLTLDSLRYWVEECHVDGFRFDLAATLARGEYGFEREGAFFKAVFQDPVLSRVKLIAEPWDVGQQDSYQLGAFPAPWAELNGKFRDDVRNFWRGEGSDAGLFAARLCGSQRLFQTSGRGPLSSINFVTCHDGFTLRDLVTYEQKNNAANGEDNRDGSDNNMGWNCGHEGETDDDDINARRRRQQRNFLATLLLSSGVPYLTAGDEFGRTQGGNNNGYAQDNEISWIDWSLLDGNDGAALRDLVKALIALRREHPILRRTAFYDGDKNPTTGTRDVQWFSVSGKTMDRDSWHNPETRSFAAVIASREGEGNSFALLLLFNGSRDPADFRLPGLRRVRWSLLLDTAEEHPLSDGTELAQGADNRTLIGSSLAIFRLAEGSPEDAQKVAR